jgi:hypothetical protein
VAKAKLNKGLTFALVFVAAGIFVFGNIVLLLFRGAKLQQMGPWRYRSS